jgi:hypothetical protein
MRQSDGWRVGPVPGRLPSRFHSPSAT